MTTTRLEVVRLEDIVISSTNPRETFDEKDLAELTESIKQDGVFTPILVRPLNADGAESWIDLTNPQAKLRDRSPRFELVCGERRYRASKNAGMEDIPANIRELTDDQAFELQIIENLQRRDVHPLEEAKAYKRMLDTGRYTIPDVAAKVAKEESFIQQRLKLNDLIPEIKQDYLHGELGIGHAVEIARLSEELQTGLYKHFKNRYNITGWGTFADLKKEIKTQSYDLGIAKFDLNSSYGIIGPCAGCSFRSSTNPILFADMQTDSCLNKPCYNSKTEAYIALKAEELITSGEEIILAMPTYSEAPAAVKAVAGKQKVPIINTQQSSQAPNFTKRKVYYVSGSDAGQVKEMWVPKSLVKNDSTANGDIKDEINKIETRAKRALELDQEKIFLGIVNSMKADFINSVVHNFKLDAVFVEALTFYLAVGSDGLWSMRDDIKKVTGGMSFEFKTPADLIEAYVKITPEQRKRLIVIVAFKKWNGQLTDKNFEGKIIRQFADSNPKIDVAGIVATQNEAAEKRIKRNEERLAELRKKLEAPKKESKAKARQ